MDKQSDSPQMILRIKRKRNEEPLDALLVQHQDMQDLGKDKRSKKDSMKSSNSTLKVSAMALPRIFRLAETVEEDSFKNINEAKKLKDRINRRIRPGTRSDTAGNLDAKRDKKTQHSQTSAKQARYRLITQNRTKVDKTMPPTVQSSSEKAAEDLFQLYEAVKDEKHRDEPKLFMDDDEENPDDIMCNFIPMVKEYLTLNDRVEEPEKDDYVYDVYYCDKSTDDADVTGPNVGSLMWFDQETEYLNEDSDSEIGDNEDEDSNAEDFYQNDYPDEEDSDEDYEDQYGYEESSDVDY
ncbi:hypothetical protein BCR42DRAFT_473019 [Absidia repens]|uniref:Probable RNA polymerase II nuclear localization protein SLC7A6OS n=1 Tax=Absidia repens TaxID=90262 RepID=A0A1X2ITQ2_9FUNG|nr:hypothetical protein BCR42DRAFT_473019 [Absidia repens]